MLCDTDMGSYCRTPRRLFRLIVLKQEFSMVAFMNDNYTVPDFINKVMMFLHT